jgi:hypothetical protein
MKGYEYIGSSHSLLILMAILHYSITKTIMALTTNIGHFIVLINYDPNDDVFIYRDPAQQDKVCVIQAEILDSARQSIGTDNDWYDFISFLD